MGARAARSLLGLIGGADPVSMSFMGETHLVVRESCGAGQGEFTREAG
jgi:LacI family transcriptional regulator